MLGLGDRGRAPAREPAGERDAGGDAHDRGAGDQDRVRPGGSTSLTPASVSVAASTIRSERSGSFTVNLPPMQDARDRADQQPAGRREVDAARDEMPGAGRREQDRRVEDVGADDLRGREREGDQHHEPEDRAAADRGQPDDEAADDPGEDGDHLVARREDERRGRRSRCGGTP